MNTSSIDLPGARYGHVLYAWAACPVEFRQREADPLACSSLVNLVSMGVLAWAVSTLARRHGVDTVGRTCWWRSTPVSSMRCTVDTSEVFGSMLVALFLLAWFRQRWAAAAVAMVRHVPREGVVPVRSVRSRGVGAVEVADEGAGPPICSNRLTILLASVRWPSPSGSCT